MAFEQCLKRERERERERDVNKKETIRELFYLNLKRKKQ